MLNKLKRAALGAHTPHDKATAASKPVPMPLPAQVRILMSQHIGAPAKALVKKGDEVFVGTKIGEAGGFVSANIHSSVSGTVAAVEPFRLSNGRMCDSVVIKTDGKQTVDPAVKAPEVTDKASFLAAVRECGLVGLGGAGFPTDVKLQPKPPVDTLLINASECEVWLTSDTQEMLNCSDDIIRGIEAVLKYVGIPKCVIGIENNKPECIDLLCQKTKDKPAIEVKPLPSVYGTGAELILIEKCLGREVPHGGLPADAGAIVMNVTSVSTLGKYLATGMPVVSRCITVDGDACAKPQNLIVPVGTAYEDVINAAGIWADKVHSIVEPANFHIIPTRGEYYLLDKSEGTRVSHVIFQCPNELGKGVLVAPTVHGNLIVGPNAEPVEGNDTSCTSSGLEFVKTTAQRSVPSINFGESIRSFAGVRANLDVDDFVIGEEPEAPGWIDLAGMKSPGLSAAPAVAEEAVAILQQRGVLGAEKADYKDGRRHIRFKELSAEEKAALVKEQPAYGRVICRCETITEGEILAALHSEVPANTIDGVKRRAGAGMGRCQGGFCGPRVLELISRELGIDPLDILQDKNGSNVLLSETKVGGKNNG